MRMLASLHLAKAFVMLCVWVVDLLSYLYHVS
jgi:hypothetical protein